MGVINNGLLDGTRRVEPGVRGLGINGSLAGAPLGTRLRGASQSGPPLVGSWKAGDQITDRVGRHWICTASGNPGTWVAAGDSGVTVKVLPPTGATATDTPNVVAAITALTTALATGPATLLFADGTYQVDSNSVVFRSPNTTTVAVGSNGAEPSTWVPGSPGTLSVASTAGFPLSGQIWAAASGNTLALVSYTGTTSTTFTGCQYVQGSATGTLATGGAIVGCLKDFTVRSAGRTVLAQAPNRAGNIGNITGNLLTIADCTDFTVEGIVFDGMRDTVSPMTPLTATAASAQPSVTVALNAGASYAAGQKMNLFGGLGTSDSNKSDGFNPGAEVSPLIISSITTGGGSGGGDLVTFTANLGNTYSQISSTPFNDPFGPYAYAGAYLTPYQTGTANSVAGRSLAGEDQQNGLHLLNCQRFTVSRCTGRNTWESPFKCGTGFASTSLTGDGCSDGSFTDCIGYHAYDQGVSLWISRRIDVKGCVMISTGWAGCSMTHSDHCNIIGNEISYSYYRVPLDNGSGCGIAVEGGKSNVVSKNTIYQTYSDCIRQTKSPLAWGASSTWATTSAFLEAQTAAGTSIQISSTTGLQVGGLYSIWDLARTEAVSVASIVDGTHVTLNENLTFSHASGVPFGIRATQETIIEGNNLNQSQTGAGVVVQGAARVQIRNNQIRNYSSSTATTGITSNFTIENGTTTYGGGYGSTYEGNTILGTCSSAMVLDSMADMIIKGNRMSGMLGSSPGLQIKGLADSEISGNHISDVAGAQGIIGGTGTLGSNNVRLTISGNRITRCNNEGMIFLFGDSLTVANNLVTSCGGNAGINPRGVTNSVFANNVCNSNQTSGIQLDNNSSTFCVNNRVIGNTCRDDGSGFKVGTGGTWTQANGIKETGSSNDNLFAMNEVDSNGTAQLTVIGAGSISSRNIVSGTIGAA